MTCWTSLYSTYTNVDCVYGPVKVHNVIGMNDTLCTTIVIEAKFDEIQIGLTQNRNVLQESN